MFGALKPGFRSLTAVKLAVNDMNVVGELNRKEQLRHRAVSLWQHGFLVSDCSHRRVQWHRKPSGVLMLVVCTVMLLKVLLQQRCDEESCRSWTSCLSVSVERRRLEGVQATRLRRLTWLMCDITPLLDNFRIHSTRLTPATSLMPSACFEPLQFFVSVVNQWQQQQM